MRRRDGGWWNIHGDPCWDTYYAVVWTVLGAVMLVGAAAALNPASYRQSRRHDCDCVRIVR